MLRHGLTNPHLLAALAGLGHTDTFALADAGLPLPPGVPVVDVSVDFGFPSFEDVASRVLPHIVAEGATIATSTPTTIREVLHSTLINAKHEHVTLHECTHEELKALLPGVKFVLRTGSTTPYANVIIRCGVGF